MYELYIAGATLEEVGTRFGVSRQRVRQIFEEEHLPTRSIAQTQSLRQQRLIEEYADDICATFIECNDVDEVARKLDIPRATVKAIVKDRIPAARRRRPRAQRVVLKYTTDELIARLQEAAATVSGVLTADAYGRYAAGRAAENGHDWPSANTYVKRFGTWNAALRQAGLPTNGRGHSQSRRKFSDRDCLEALRESARRLEMPPTIAAYDDLARASSGKLPSAMTIINRLGTWYGALTKAGV